MSIKRLHKKAQADNWLAVIVVLFISGFMIILSYLMITEIKQGFDDAGHLSPEAEMAVDGILRGVVLMDYLMVLLMIALIVGVAITSYKIATSPVFVILTFILAAFYGFISYYFNFVFAQMIGIDVFATVLVFFPRTILICTNLHWVMLALIVIGIITLYGKREKGQFLS